MKNAASFISIFALLTLTSNVTTAQSITIAVKDTTFHAIGDDFFGLQYHADTYDDNNAIEKLKALHARRIRIWADVTEFHPSPGVWNWTELDRKTAEVLDAGFKFILCLYQGDAWFVGTPENPWWNHQAALTEWDKAAFHLTERYQNDIDRIIIFDEPNMLHKEREYYIPFKQCAQLFIRAAQEIKKAKPGALCGGPSSFGGWENGHWANYVFAEPGGDEALDFVSCNIFLSWNADDEDETIMDRTIWYEESAQKIKVMTSEHGAPSLLLDAYNASALWKKDGELWTDPGNVSVFGGVYQAAALLHSAKGGFEIALHWETVGGFGVLNWPPQFKELPPYHAWKFLVETAGMKAGARILDCTSTESPKPEAPHHSGMNVNLYEIQPFAIERADGGVSVILINKYAGENHVVSVTPPLEMRKFAKFRFDAERILDYAVPLETGILDGAVEITCPPLSISIIRFERQDPVGLDVENATVPQEIELSPSRPNPFRTTAVLDYSLTKPGQVLLTIHNILGEQVRVVVNEHQSAGKHQAAWDGRNDAGEALSSGVYYFRLHAANVKLFRKVLFLKN